MLASTYLSETAALPYCRGCGHGHVVRELGAALPRVPLEARSIALVTDIGCVGLADALFPELHTIHTTHGRSTAFAAGLAMAQAVLGSEPLKTVVMIGDGGAMIGLVHLVHAAQLNVNLTVLLHNNFLFGMTGGQQSSLTPLEFVTTTSPGGNLIPPVDILALLSSAGAGFLARIYATDRELGPIITRALRHPGFALVEIFELCTAFGTRLNELSGARLRELVAEQGWEMGVLRADARRPAFADTYRQQAARLPCPAPSQPMAAQFEHRLAQPVRMVVAGTAGERVQSAAHLLCQAAALAGLHSTQKNDNPVTQGTGFSLAEVCLSSERILFTGMEGPNILIAVSADGLKELQARGELRQAVPGSELIVDESLNVPETPTRVTRLPFRQRAGAKGAALAALVGTCLARNWLPGEALEAALEHPKDTKQAESAQTVAVGRELSRQLLRTS